MPLYLKDNWAILVDPANFFLTNTAYPGATWFTLDWRHCLVLASLDGSHTPGSISRHIARMTGATEAYAARLVELTFRRYHQCIAEDNKAHDKKPRIYRLKRPLPLTDLQRARNCAPRKLTWVSTILCNKHCKYCYMDARRVSGEKPVSLPVGPVHRVAEEAARLAVTDIHISGGEPFLSDDMYDAVNSFIDHGIYVTVTTKSRVDGSRFAPGARELLTVECSLDSTDRSLVSFLTGSRSSFDEAMGSMGSLSRSRIRFRIKMVAGKANYKEVPAMARLCKDASGEALHIVEYQADIGRYFKDFVLDDGRRRRMLDDIDRARRDTGIGIEYSIGPLKGAAYDGIPGSYCPEGIESLSFLSDGTCTKCPALPYDRNLTGGSVFDEGIYGVWNLNEDYRSRVFPDESNYSGTICYECEGRGECSLTGRCISRSQMRHGTYYGPDRECRYNSMEKPGAL